MFPRWLRDVVPGSGPFNFEYRDDDGATRAWSSADLSATARAVCAGCNSGWMASLETAARPLLEPMMRGDDVELDEGGQTLVARWVVKTATMLDQASAKHIARVHLIALAAGGVPREGTFVWLGRYVGRFGASCRSVRMDVVGERTGRSSKAYSVFVTVGDFAAMAMAVDFDDELAATTSVRVPPEGSEYLIQIRPAQDGSVRWPPNRVIDDGLLPYFQDAFVPPTLRGRHPGGE